MTTTNPKHFKTGQFLIDIGPFTWTLHFVYHQDDEFLYLTRILHTEDQGNNMFNSFTDFGLNYKKLLPILHTTRRDDPIHTFEQCVKPRTLQNITFVQTLEDAHRLYPEILSNHQYQQLLEIQDFFINFRQPQLMLSPQGGL